jgi:ribosome-binding protein aMBF1 (putative translation factor)
LRRTSNAVEILDAMVGKDAELRRLVERETLSAHIARLIYQARTEAGLTQERLAKLVGTRQPVIARLENSEYRGHSLSMLSRIAKALNHELEIRLKPRRSHPRAA